jgi:hypothetical protein
LNRIRRAVDALLAEIVHVGAGALPIADMVGEVRLTMVLS